MADISVAIKEMDKATGIFDKIASGCARAAEQCLYIGSILSKNTDIMKRTSSATDALSAALDDYDQSASAVIYAAQETRTVTEAELIVHNHKLKTFQSFIQTGEDLKNSIESNNNAQKELSATVEKTTILLELLSSIDNISAEKKNNLTSATKNLDNTTVEMTKSQLKAAIALESLARTAESGSINQGNLKVAQDKVATASERMTTANSKAATAADELSKATDQIAEKNTRTRESLESYAAATVEATKIQKEMSKASEAATFISEKLAKSNSISATTKKTLAEATDKVKKSSSELAAAQEKATAAAGNLAKAANNSETSYEELMDAQRQSVEATKSLEMANKNASESMGGLSKAVAKAGTEFVASQVLEWTGKAAEALIKLGNEFSNAQSVIVKATGATGNQLDGFSDSMMNVYATSSSGDLSTVAGAIGDVSTLLGMQGSELEETTSLFMDYSRVTGTNVSEAVQNAAGIMKSWGLEADNTEGILDKLTIAGQKSGISVDALSSTLTQNQGTLQGLGFGLDQSIALFSMLDSQGISTSEAMDGMNSAFERFSANGQDASVAMQELINNIANAEDPAEAASLATEMFGKNIGDNLSTAIRNGDLDAWTASVERADGTLSQTAKASETLEEKWTKASNSFKSAFSSVFSPAVEGISSLFAGIVGGIGNFLNQNPAVLAALTGLAVGIIAITVATQAQTIATGIQTAATAAHMIAEAALNAVMALNPVFLIAAGIAALVTGIAIFVSSMGDANKEFDELSATSKRDREELDALNKEYERTVAIQGEASPAAKELADKIAGQQAVFEANRMTMEEFTAKCEALVESHNNIITSFQEGTAEIDKEEKGSAALIAKLEGIAKSSDDVATKKAKMSGFVDQLNKQYPGLALSVDKLTDSTNGTIDALRERAAAEATAQRQALEWEKCMSLVKEQTDLEEQLTKAKIEREAADKRCSEAFGGKWFGKAADDYKILDEQVNNLTNALNENKTAIEENEKAIEEMTRAMDEAANAPVAYETAVNSAVVSSSDALTTLADSYDAASESARSTLDGLVGVYDAVGKKAELTSEQVMAAWQSQIDYFNEYNKNLELLSSYEELSPELFSKISDGSEQSIALAKSLTAELEKLKQSTESGEIDNSAAEARLKEMSDQYAEVEKTKDKTSTTMAEISTNFETELEIIRKEMLKTVEDMNMEEDAAIEAEKTINAYVGAIKSGVDKAATAAEAMANAAVEKLEKRGISIVGVAKVQTEMEANANGTTNASNIFIAGEEGPELIIGARGSTVFPAEETQKIIAAVSQSPMNAEVPIIPNSHKSITKISVESTENIDHLEQILNNNMEISLTRAIENINQGAFEAASSTSEEFQTGIRGYLTDTIAPTNLSTTERVPIGAEVPKGFELQTNESTTFKTTEEKKITLDINGTGGIDISGGIDQNKVLDLMVDNMKPVLMRIVRQEIFEEGELSYGF